VSRRLAELAIARDIDAEVVLVPHDLGHGRPEPTLKTVLVGRLAGFAGPVRLDQVVRAWQALDMRGEDAIAARPHLSPPIERLSTASSPAMISPGQ